MNIHRRLIPKIVAVLVGALIPIVSNVPMAQATCSQYQIGYQGPLTGSEAYFGQDQLAAVKFALSKFRSANPSVNVSPDVVQIDDQGDPSVAAVVAPTVAANSCILGIVGPAFTGAAIVSFPAYKAAGLPVITPSATRPSLTDPTSPAFGGPIFHRNVLLDSQIYLDMFSDIGAATPKANVAYFHQDAYNSMPTGGPLGVNLWDFAF